MKSNKALKILFSGSLVLPQLVFSNTDLQKNIEKANLLIKEQINLNNQKEKFNTIQKQEESEKKFYETEQILVEADKDEIECVEIEKIDFKGATLFDNQSFEELKKPYLNNCNGMANLKNLLNKITNLYIDKGYVTSRAYLKQQDLSDGSVEIDILESKIENIEFVNTKPLDFMSIYKDKILNLRDLEVELQQRDRLRSLNYNIELQPGTKQGYTIVKVVASSDGNPYYGNLSVNNFGSISTGKYQIALSGNYENLFDLSDIMGISLNTTNNVFKPNNYSKSGGFDFSFPLQKFLIDFNYNYSKFDILSKDEFSHNVITFGNSNSISLKSNYKLYHGEKHSVELNGVYSRKQNTNFLTVFIEDENLNLLPHTTTLAQQSHILSNLMFGIKHEYKTEGINYYSNFSITQGLSKQSKIDKELIQHTEFTKYSLDVSFSKRFQSDLEPTYNLSFNGQVVNKDVLSSDELSIGGPYSVRGFGKAGLAGEKGFFIRNDFSINTNIDNFRFSPYLGLDYGYIAHFQDFTQKGDILGGGVGIKSSYKDTSFDLFYHKPLVDDSTIKDLNSEFIGFTFNYNF